MWVVPPSSVVRHMNDRGVAYAHVASPHRFITCYPGSTWTESVSRAPQPFTGAKPGYVYTFRNGRTGYHRDKGMQQEYYPSTFTLAEPYFASLLDFCTDHLKTLYPNHVSVVEFVYKHVKRISNNYKCNVDVMLPGHDSWIPLMSLGRLFQLKVTRYQKPHTRTEHIVLLDHARVGDLVRHVEKQFRVNLDSFDLKMREGGDLDVSDETVLLSDLALPRLAAVTLQHKDLQGKVVMHRGEMSRQPPVDSTKFMTMGDFLKRGGYKDDDDDDDDVVDDESKQPTKRNKRKKPVVLYRDDFEAPPMEEPEVIPKRQRPPILDVAVDDQDAVPFFNDLGDGRIGVGFYVSADMTHLLPEFLTPAGFFHMEPLIKQHGSDCRRRIRQEKKQQQPQQQPM